ncbi:dihydrofolate reductase family protein [Micromonospora sp. WMMD1102]|uniref:dihydrofolate reductase family protein n=1 Tax=Micromonospora sp. WMMD1102 TaxID=3016105 RepID=UPI0024158030|nr:dihydrofolate reductase family protein [Micromonospora sp. WMMD1102]MDG4791760.1 dihydrofolate reductase family protein [Micromonospora sp. WMMD1102]
MGKVIVKNQVTVNGAFEAPSPEDWLELDADSGDTSLQQMSLADAMLLGRKTYEGLAAVWPHLGEHPSMGAYAGRINRMPKYVASRTLIGPLDWNAILIEGDVVQAVPALKERHTGNLIVSGCGELAYTLAQQGLVDEFWFFVNPHVWPDGPRILDGVGPIRLQLIAATSFRSGVVWLRYGPAGA